MNSFRELLDADAHDDMCEEFIRFHGKEWLEKNNDLITDDVPAHEIYDLRDNVLSVCVDIDDKNIRDVLIDLGVDVLYNVDTYLFVETNGKKWASMTDKTTGRHKGFYDYMDVVPFAAEICGPEWVNHLDKSGLHMGFYCYPGYLPELAMIGGPEFVNHQDSKGRNIGFRCHKKDIPLLAEIGGPGWNNPKNEKV